MNTLQSPPAMQDTAVGCSAISPTNAGLLARSRPFESFGEWQEEITVARQGTLWRLADWIACNRSAARSRPALWQACQQANPACFKTYSVIRLDRPSFFLPAGEVVFEVTKNPTQIPQSPPQGVMLRHMEAMDAFPGADFYFLEPVFTSEPCLRLYSATELREEASGDLQDVLMLARNYGWLFRTADWAGRQRDRLAEHASRLAVAVEEKLRAATERLLAPPKRASDLEELARRAEQQGRFDDAVRLRRSLAEIRWHMTIDPLLCFGLPSQPGRLWFEAHWYVGQDSRTYVHY